MRKNTTKNNKIERTSKKNGTATESSCRFQGVLDSCFSFFLLVILFSLITPNKMFANHLFLFPPDALPNGPPVLGLAPRPNTSVHPFLPLFLPYPLPSYTYFLLPSLPHLPLAPLPSCLSSFLPSHSFFLMPSLHFPSLCSFSSSFVPSSLFFILACSPCLPLGPLLSFLPHPFYVLPLTQTIFVLFPHLSLFCLFPTSASPPFPSIFILSDLLSLSFFLCPLYLPPHPHAYAFSSLSIILLPSSIISSLFSPFALFSLSPFSLL